MYAVYNSFPPFTYYPVCIIGLGSLSKSKYFDGIVPSIFDYMNN